MKEQPQSQNRLHGFAQPHLVRQECGVARHEKGDAFHLVRVWLERQPDLPAREQVLQRRLQQVEKAFLEDHRFARGA